MALRLAILYVGSRCPRDFVSSDPQLSLVCVDTPEAITGPGQRPDIVLMDPFVHDAGISPEKAQMWFDAFSAHKFKFFPAVFVIVPEETRKSIRLTLMEFGADQVVDWPLDIREIKVKAKSAVDAFSLKQDLFSKNSSLEKSFIYLDRFKGELKAIKDELLEDKSNLNTALKQIHQMSQERRRLKESLLSTRKQQVSDVDGFGRILYSLIRQRLEKNRGHGERVGKIACFIAEQMGVSQKKLEDLSKAGMLHEVGLLFLSDDGFAERMPGSKEVSQHSDLRSTAYDQVLMVQFSVKGAQLLANCQGFEGVADIIRFMNENSDGTGYPDGLERKHIPLESRILAGADELETLRENNTGAGIGELLVGLEPLIGSRLDPMVAGWLEKYAVIHFSGKTPEVRGLGVEQLVPGMVLGATLFTRTGTKLLSAGTVLTQAAIDKVIQYHKEYPVDETVYIRA
ncbi:HD domain-containing phosphohydrolase [uncultured Desulfobacter sp.]|uniref:HD-GYP domain-containing protein n=1 Tax=uncultured Desulfobacter sp. TaxID=240139 RepID=UPI002AAA6B90|nr:HD domain-containing phosphohydrolase [uncultured Desulfobacter sp.]